MKYLILKLATILIFTFDLSILTYICSRFVIGGPDTWGIFAIFIQSILAMLALGGPMTRIGRELTGSFLARFKKIPKKFWHVSVAIVLLLFLAVVHSLLPEFAFLYNKRGIQKYEKKEWLTSAKNDFERAVKLDPDYAEAHYNLGVVYEDLHDFKKAQAEYTAGLNGREGPFDAAYNNLGRLYILKKEYSSAAAFLEKGLPLAREDGVKYDMLKNLGWARLGQKRYIEAGVKLKQAIEIMDNRAPAHCILAQVLDAQKDIKEARKEWEKCIQYASSLNPDEDAWIGSARKALAQKDEKGIDHRFGQ